MSWSTLRFATALALFTSWCGGPAEAAPGDVQTFNFFQNGFSEGATVSGSFSGVDLDGNGILVHFPGQEAPPVNVLELNSFAMHFSGNSLASAFDLTLADLYGFVFQLNTSGIGDDPAFDPEFGELREGIGAIGSNFFYTTGLGPTSSPGNSGIIGGYVGGEITFDDLFDVAELALDSSPNVVRVLPVPEPAAIALLFVAMLGMSCVRSHAGRL